ncbi:MAG TPA: outer membrane beta-barrel protein [Hyphomicrobiales bacterium]|nr:outer membrane beta-barrel protein [Hyphomicrobiales bacterium]
MAGLGGALLSPITANAADLIQPIIPAPAAPVVTVSGFYLRGDVGFSNQTVRTLDNALYSTVPGGPGAVVHAQKGFDAAPIADIGIGYKWNRWLRTDVTAEYRGGANFHGMDLFPVAGGGSGVDQYSATKSEWLFLANAYVDLGTWWCVTPFVGAGVGAARNTISNFTDAGLNLPGAGGPPVASNARGATESQWNFAWALYGGLAFDITPNLTVELSYRYLSLGNAHSGDLIAFDGTNTVYNPMKFKDLASSDVRIGLRYLLN